jgi:plasmid stability protein
MAKTLTITLPDDLEQALTQTAAQANQSTEALVLQLLTQKFTPVSAPSIENDPLIALFGSIQSNYPDLADNHDYYLGQALSEEMHRNE